MQNHEETRRATTGGSVPKFAAEKKEGAPLCCQCLMTAAFDCHEDGCPFADPTNQEREDMLLYGNEIEEVIELAENIAASLVMTPVRRRALVMACCEIARVCGWARPLPGQPQLFTP